MMYDTKVLEVRCCCDPGKFLGMLEVPRELARKGGPLRCRLQERLEGTPDQVSHSRFAPPTVLLEVARLNMNGVSVMAVKSNDVPLETLRKIPGFSETAEPFRSPEELFTIVEELKL